nr:conserved phage C-terminal domain-containing protein [Caballeronia sp. dw_19]
MPLHVQRLLNSDLAADETPETCWAALLLWSVSWHEVPCASVPDDDEWIAKRARYWHRGKLDAEWVSVREGALRGWIRCSDGRLYHPVVAENALEAWIEKLLNSHAGAVGNSKRWGVDADTDGIKARVVEAASLLRAIAPQSKTLRKKGVVVIVSESPPDQIPSPPDIPFVAPRSVEASGATEIESPPDDLESPPDRPPIAPDGFNASPRSLLDRNRQGQGQGQGQVNLKPLNLLSGNPDDADTEEDHGQTEIALDASDPVREVIEYLNARAGAHFRFVESNARLIRGRLKEGCSVADMKAVIDAQNRNWPPGDKMRQYFRPSTLFNATRFEQYLGVLKTGAAGARSTGPDADSWWRRAGFEFEYEAINAGCSEKYAHLWRDGARIVTGEAA